MFLARVVMIAFSSALFACQGGSTPEEIRAAEAEAAAQSGSAAQTSSAPQTPSAKVEHSSEAVIGPDDAFFSAVYLEQMFRSSKNEARPELNPTLALTASQQAGAFDFAANFSEARLSLMAKALLLLGDSDKDESLSESEFLALRLDLSVFGAGSEVIAHKYGHELYQQAVGENAGLDEETLKGLLRGVAPLIKATIEQKTASEQRLQILKAWEKILSEFDSDKNGSLSFVEQKEARKARAEIMARLKE